MAPPAIDEVVLSITVFKGKLVYWLGAVIKCGYINGLPK